MKLTDLRGILQYVPQFRDKTFILAIDGGIVADDNFATLLLDVALLWSLNIRVVLVHGAAAQIQSLANELYANEYEHIRPAKKKDVRAIRMLTRQAVEADELVRRTKGMIERNLEDHRQHQHQQPAPRAS